MQDHRTKEGKATVGATTLDSKDQVLDDIREVNLSYLLLAQRLLQNNFAAGMFRLGMSEDVAHRILRLSPAQTIKLAGSSVLLCGFRLNDDQMLSALTQDSLGGILQQAHTTILLAQQPVNETNKA